MYQILKIDYWKVFETRFTIDNRPVIVFFGKYFWQSYMQEANSRILNGISIPAKIKRECNIVHIESNEWTFAIHEVMNELSACKHVLKRHFYNIRTYIYIIYNYVYIHTYTHMHIRDSVNVIPTLVD